MTHRIRTDPTVRLPCRGHHGAKRFRQNTHCLQACRGAGQTPHRPIRRPPYAGGVRNIAIMNPKHIRNIIAVTASAAAVLIFSRLHAEMPSGQETPPNIVVVAAGNSDFSTLVSALRAADLVGTLEGKGPFTVFAPNNAAFAKLPAGTLEDLLKPENKKKLARLLKNHVVSGRITAGEVKSGMVKTLDGKKVEVAVENGKVGFGGAKVIAADLPASNGVIHVIDTVVVAD